MRVAVVHYSSEPVPGGVERLIGEQVWALDSLRIPCRLIVGQGRADGHAEICRLPDLRPSSAKARRGRELFRRGQLDDKHRLVRDLSGQLMFALTDCTHVWVHNAFTITLHPALTLALAGLVKVIPNMKWTAWCEDLTAGSSFVPSEEARLAAGFCRPPSGVRSIALTAARKQELITRLDCPPLSIQIVEPPIDWKRLLGMGKQANHLASDLRVEEASAIVLVPSKRLPHKNLCRAASIGSYVHDLLPGTLTLITGGKSAHEPERARPLQPKQPSGVVLLSERRDVSLSRRLIRDLLLMSDLVFLPSAEEGYGLPVSEALAVKTPVLCSDIPALHAAGSDAVEFFEPTSSDVDIAAHIVRLISSPEALARRRLRRSRTEFRDQLRRLLELQSTPGVNRTYTPP